MSNQSNDLIRIGTNTPVDIIPYATEVLAKIDTGADSSAVWASNIHVTSEGVLEFVLFGKGSPHYTGEVIRRKDFSVAVVRSSNGHEQIRYRTKMAIRLGGRRVRATLNLSDRSRNDYPLLIGRRTLHGKFLVDVSKYHRKPVTGRLTGNLNEILKADPAKFHDKYYKK